MRMCFIGSGIERESTRLRGVEIASVAKVIHPRFHTLVFGGSNVGLMSDFAGAFDTLGGHVVSVIPEWLDRLGMTFDRGSHVRCADLAERKRLMFDEVNAVLCYPGGVGTWDELFDLLARRAIDSAVDGKPPCPPIFLYNWEKFYAPLLLQLETAVEVGLIKSETVRMVHPFESCDELATLLDRHFPA